MSWNRGTALKRGPMAAAFLVLTALFLAACGGNNSGAAESSTTASGRNITAEEANRALVTDFYDGFFNKHDIASASVIADDYKQHNPEVPDGKQPFVDYFSGFFVDNPQSRGDVVRSATDGDLVYLHVRSTNGPQDRGQAVVDIFRVKDGKIVEHWDVIQNVPETAANSNTMF